MKATFDHVESVTPDISTFWFQPERPVRYLAGQFTEIQLPHDPADARGVKRWFTLSSSPTEDLVAITTKFAPHSVQGRSLHSRSSTFKRQLRALKPGAKLTLADPMGDFVLPKDPQVPLVFVAGGMGITPVRSMVKWLLDKGEQRSIQLVYAVSRIEDMAFEPLLKKYGLAFTPIVSHPPAGYGGETGPLTSRRILELIGHNDQSLIYLSGPEPMIEAFYKELVAIGIPSERLVTDYFHGYQRF